MRRFMVIEHFKRDCQEAVYERFYSRGRMLPEGLIYLDSWLEKSGGRCFQLVETEDPALFEEWEQHWNDLVDFEIIEIGDKPVKYRELLPADMDAIFDVRVKTWHNPHGAEELHKMGITPDSVCEMVQVSHRGWVAEDGEQIVGFVMGNRDTAELWVIAVLPEYENQGIGRALMGLAEEWLFSEGCHEIWLTTDSDENFCAVGFYRHLGWKDWKIEDGDRFMKKVSNLSVDSVQKG
ncbi:MAG: GNAT family N-acetyltransferase [Verrucomicrobiota bacterium]